MEIDQMEVVERASEAGDRATMRLNMLVAITVALLATFMGVCKVKDDNICQTMQQAQANKIDHWSYYQAHNIREEIARSTLLQLQLSADTAAPPAQARYQGAIASYTALAADQKKKKEELKGQAEQDQKDYDGANFRDDQFDLSDVLLAIAISLLAMTALTHQRWLYAVALLPTFFGTVMGLSGLLGWSIHPNGLIQLLS
ncbi:MAG TPA: DUF4337 domain-containing protein [Janthinobacterium sp.]|nr:DUF4337 domain-containing protein [Janthinobacterium sp.]